MTRTQTAITYDDGGADLSQNERYRYRLWRSWGPGSRCAFVMLNPSTADASKDDATIRRCIGYARLWRFDGIEVVNLFALRSTNPKILYRYDNEFCKGPANDDAIADAANSSSLVVCAWGNHGGLYKRSQSVLIQLRHRCVPQALAVTKQDQPAHPLFLNSNLKPFSWDGRDRR